MARTTTQVSKSNPTIKKILAATVGASWRGRTVSILEVPPGWEQIQYIDDQMHAWYLNLATLPSARPYVRATPRPTYGGPNIHHKRPEGNEVFVQRERFLGKDLGVEIAIPDDAINSAALSVATDALIQKDKKAATAVLAQCGAFAGLAMAIAEANVKTLGKAETGAEPRTERAGAKLQREIDAVLGRRG